MFNFQEMFPNYDVSENGTVFKNGIEMIPFKSNKYLQVVLFDKNGKKRVCGVHTVVAMKYLDYSEGCIVHHIDENTHNNSVNNLCVITKSEHSKLHYKTNKNFRQSVHGGWNRGLKMSEEFCRKASEAAKKRHKQKIMAV